MKILFTPYSGGSIAHIVRSLAIADELKDRGHEILFTTTTGKKSFIENAGFKVYGSGHSEVNLNDENDQSIQYFIDNKDKFLDWLGDEVKATQDFKPDVIINSPSFFGNITGRKHNIPYISLINTQWLTEFKGLLGLGKSQDSFSHNLTRKIGRPIFTKKFESIYLREIRKYYQYLGVDFIPPTRSSLHVENPAIIPGIPDFEPIEKNSRKDICYVGPLFWKGFEKDDFHPSKYFSDTSKPLIYVSLGGSIFREKSYQDLINAFVKQDKWNVVLSLGPNFQRNLFVQNCPHFVILPYVPGLKVCEFADIVVNTAGHGTVMQALWHGKPMITIPHNIDQGGISSRLEDLGLGINLNKAGLSDFSNRERYYKQATQVPWNRILNEVTKVLNNPKFSKNAQEYKKKMREYDNGARNSADFIEKSIIKS